MTYPIDHVKPIEAPYRQRLQAEGIYTTGELLQSCRTAHDRSDIAARTGIGEDRLLSWAKLADLTRLRGLGLRFAELLVACGVDTFHALRMHNAERLFQRLQSVNQAHRLAKIPPSRTLVTHWVWASETVNPRVTR